MLSYAAAGDGATVHNHLRHPADISKRAGGVTTLLTCQSQPGGSRKHPDGGQPHVPRLRHLHPQLRLSWQGAAVQHSRDHISLGYNLLSSLHAFAKGVCSMCREVHSCRSCCRCENTAQSGPHQLMWLLVRVVMKCVGQELAKLSLCCWHYLLASSVTQRN